MAHLTMRIALVSALALSVAACSKKKVEELPPAPAATAPATTPEAPPAATTGTTTVPGSRADFLEQAGTDTIHFGTDLYDIDAESQAILTKQAAWLTKYPNTAATIEGHADERGTREYNLALGDRRANSARDYLQSRGVPATRMQTISWGKERPAVDGHDESAWAQNRRAVTVVPE